jgi:hypothetical protein
MHLTSSAACGFWSPISGTVANGLPEARPRVCGELGLRCDGLATHARAIPAGARNPTYLARYGSFRPPHHEPQLRIETGWHWRIEHQARRIEEQRAVVAEPWCL